MFISQRLPSACSDMRDCDHVSSELRVDGGDATCCYACLAADSRLRRLSARSHQVGDERRESQREQTDAVSRHQVTEQGRSHAKLPAASAEAVSVCPRSHMKAHTSPTSSAALDHLLRLSLGGGSGGGLVSEGSTRSWAGLHAHGSSAYGNAKLRTPIAAM